MKLAFHLFIVLVVLGSLATLFPSRVLALSCAYTEPKIGRVQQIILDANEPFSVHISQAKTFDSTRITSQSNTSTSSTLVLDEYDVIVAEYLQDPTVFDAVRSDSYNPSSIQLSEDYKQYHSMQLQDIIVQGPPFHVCSFGFVGIYTPSGQLKQILLTDDYQGYSYNQSKFQVQPDKEVSCDRHVCLVEVAYQFGSQSVTLAADEHFLPQDSFIHSIRLLDARNYKNNDAGQFYDWGISQFHISLLNTSVANTQDPPHQSAACKYDLDSNGVVQVGDLLEVLQRWFNQGISGLIGVLRHWGDDCVVTATDTITGIQDDRSFDGDLSLQTQSYSVLLRIGGMLPADMQPVFGEMRDFGQLSPENYLDDQQKQQVIGREIEIVAKRIAPNNLTLEGSSDYYVRLLSQTAVCGNNLCEENEYVPCPEGAQCIWAGSCPQDCTAELSDQQKCSQAGGSYDAVHNECNGLDQQQCSNISGSYNGCASACRHDPNAQVCTEQCVQVCSLGMSWQDCTNTPGYVIMESYPRQCRIPDGRTVVEPI